MSIRWIRRERGKRLTKQLSILQVITPSRYSGAERVVTFLSAALQQAGHRLVVATKPNERLEAELDQRGIAVRTPGLSGKLNLAVPLRIVGLAREIDADLIHTHLSTAGLWGSVAGRLLGIPVLAHVHALNTKWCYRLADAVATPSEGVRQHLIGQGMAPDRIHVIYNGLPAERYTHLTPAEQMRSQLGLPVEAALVAVVAHLSRKKGHRYLLEAVARLRGRHPDLHCLIVGEGPLRAELKRLAQRLDIADRVHFLGYREDAVAIMQTCDIVALLGFKEGLPLCLIEAAFLGKPTIGNDAPGIDEAIVDGETGLLVAPGDAGALSEAIDRLLSDEQLSRRLGENGRRRAQEKFTIEAQSEATLALYRQMIAAAKQDRP